MVPDVEYAARIWWNKLDKATRSAMMDDHPDAYRGMPQSDWLQCIIDLYENGYNQIVYDLGQDVL